MIGCGGLIGLFILIWIIYAVFVPQETKDRLEAERKAQEQQERIDDSLAELQKASVPTPSESIAVEPAKPESVLPSREEIMDWAKEKHEGLNFSKGKDNPEMGENYIGNDDIYIYQIFGANDRVVNASATAGFAPNSSKNYAARAELVAFAMFMGADSTDWIDEATAEEELQTTKEIVKEFGGLKYDLNVAPIQGTGTFVTLTVKLPK